MNRRPWTSGELSILRMLYADTRTEDLVEFVDHPLRSIYCKALKLGLRKSPEFIAKHCRRRDAEFGAGSRFKPGHKTWNKGMNYQAGGRSVESQFKPGSKPRNYHPVGAERVTKDGLLQRKVTDTGYSPRDWVAVHALVWQEHNGPIPRGHIVVFKDRDNRNFDIDNLEVISRAENMRRNSCHLYPKEVARLIQLRGALNRKINERARREKQD